MSLIVRTRVSGTSEYVQRLTSMPEAVQAAIEKKMRLQAADISARIKQKLSGELLNVKSGALRNSIYARIYSSKNRVLLSVGSRGDVPYAALHNYGGVVQHPGVSSDKVVVFRDKGGSKVFSRGISPHSIPIPERNFVESTIDDSKGELIQDLIDAVAEAARGR